MTPGVAIVNCPTEARTVGPRERSEEDGNNVSAQVTAGGPEAYHHLGPL